MTTVKANECRHHDVSIQEVCSFYHAAPTGDCQFHFYDCFGFGDLINNQASVEYIERFLVDAHHDWLKMNVNRIPEQVGSLFMLIMTYVYILIKIFRERYLGSEFSRQTNPSNNIRQCAC